MSTRKSGLSPYEFTAAAHDEVRSSEHNFRVVWAISCLPTERRGVWNVHIQVIDVARGASTLPVARYEAQWPNATPQTFEAFLYSTCYKVARMVEAWGLQWAAEQARARA